MSMKKIAKAGFVIKPHAVGVEEVLMRTIAYFERRGIRCLLEKAAAEKIGEKKGLARERIPGASDLVVVLGGDGTLLSIAHLAAQSGIPVMGVNMGRLGFLTEIPTEEVVLTLDHLLDGGHAGGGLPGGIREDTVQRGVAAPQRGSGRARRSVAPGPTRDGGRSGLRCVHTRARPRGEHGDLHLPPQQRAQAVPRGQQQGEAEHEHEVNQSHGVADSLRQFARTGTAARARQHQHTAHRRDEQAPGGRVPGVVGELGAPPESLMYRPLARAVSCKATMALKGKGSLVSGFLTTSMPSSMP